MAQYPSLSYLDPAPMIETAREVLDAVRRTDLAGKYAGVTVALGPRLEAYSPTLSFEIGDEPDRYRAGRCRGYASEKIGRLRANPTHVTSFESRDTSQKRYGGGVFVDDWDIATSGLEVEEADQAVSLLLAVQGAMIELYDAIKIALKVNDHSVRILCKAFVIMNQLEAEDLYDVLEATSHGLDLGLIRQILKD